MKHAPLPSVTRRAALGGLAAVGFSPGTTLAQALGGDVIRIIVGFAPGSSNDLIARDVAALASPMLKKTIVVENKPGAGGMLGTDLVAKARPDGLTLGLGTSSQLVMNPGLYKSMPFDVDRDLRMIGLISRTPLILLGRRDGPGGLKALVDQARANPGKTSYGSAGAGSITHIVAEAFANALDIKLTHVPYKGNAAAMTDLLGGHVDLVFDTLRNAIPLMQQGKVHALGYGGKKRSASLPQVPTFHEEGLKDYDSYTWNCLFAPAQTPDEIALAINRALNDALTDRKIGERFAHDEVEALAPSTPQDADAFGRRERARWVPFIRKLGIQIG